MVAKTNKIQTVFKQSKKKQDKLKDLKSSNTKREVSKQVINNGKLTKEDAENLLIKFDLDPLFGPCSGISRKNRYLIANKLELSPPKNILDLIEKYELPISIYDQRLSSEIILDNKNN